MTFTYIQRVSNGKSRGFFNVLLIWQASVYKVLYKEFLVYFGAFVMIAAAYHCSAGYYKMNHEVQDVTRAGKFLPYQDIETAKIDYAGFQSRNLSNPLNSPSYLIYFEFACRKIQPYSDELFNPLVFVLGFYVNIIVVRWWNQWNSIPWPDRLSHVIVANVRGNDNRGKLIRRNLIRYVNVASLMVYRLISPTIQNKYPEFINLHQAGYISKEEHDLYVNCESDHWKYWMPFSWFSNLVRQAYDEGRIPSDNGFRHLIEELNNYRSGLGTIVGYDWVNIPLVYTQVVTIAVHSYFIMQLLAQQYLEPHSDENIHHNEHRSINSLPLASMVNFNDVLPVNETQQIFATTNSTQNSTLLTDELDNHDINLNDSYLEHLSYHFIKQPFSTIAKYFPIYMMLEFLIFMGWLKVAEQLINPFGQDDDDFELEEIIDRNDEIAMRIVDDSIYSMPELFDDEIKKYKNGWSSSATTVKKDQMNSPVENKTSPKNQNCNNQNFSPGNNSVQQENLIRCRLTSENSIKDSTCNSRFSTSKNNLQQAILSSFRNSFLDNNNNQKSEKKKKPYHGSLMVPMLDRAESQEFLDVVGSRTTLLGAATSNAPINSRPMTTNQSYAQNKESTSGNQQHKESNSIINNQDSTQISYYGGQQTKLINFDLKNDLSNESSFYYEKTGKMDSNDLCKNCSVSRANNIPILSIANNDGLLSNSNVWGVKKKIIFNNFTNIAGKFEGTRLGSNARNQG